MVRPSFNSNPSRFWVKVTLLISATFIPGRLYHSTVLRDKFKEFANLVLTEVLRPSQCKRVQPRLCFGARFGHVDMHRLAKVITVEAESIAFFAENGRNRPTPAAIPSSPSSLRSAGREVGAARRRRANPS